MAKKTKKAEKKEKTEKQPPFTDDDQREDALLSAQYALKKAESAEDVRATWRQHYLIIGHRVLGRLLLGQDAESATRTRRQSE